MSAVALNTQPSALYDADLPNALAVMATLNCVAVRYAKAPSLALARLASRLAYTLTAPEYAESKLIAEVASKLVFDWDGVVRSYQEASHADDHRHGMALQ